MKFLFRWAFRFLILAIVLLVAALLLKDAVIKSVAESRLRQSLGLEVRIGKMEVGLLTPTVSIEGLRVYNPPEFGGSPFLDIPELHVEYDQNAATRGAARLKLLRLNVAELNVVRNAAGQTNLAGLVLALSRDPGKAPAKARLAPHTLVSAASRRSISRSARSRSRISSRRR